MFPQTKAFPRLARVVMAIVLLTLLWAPAQLSAQIPSPTWGENISCIVFSHCAPCHHEGGIAPFSLMTYADAAPKASVMAFVTDEGIMPPWKPDHKANAFLGERVLSATEIFAFQQWAAAGAPLGDTTDMLDQPVFGTAGIDTPDFTLKLPDYTIQDLGPGNDDFVCVNTDMGNPTPAFMTAFELVPGGPVHHSLVAIQSDHPDTTQFCYSPTSKRVIAGWAPSAQVFKLPDGMGIPILANSDIEVNLHFPHQNAGMLDSSRINMKLSFNPSLRKVRMERLLHHGFHIIGDLDSVETSLGAPLVLPPDKVKTVWAYREAPQDMLLLSVNPHMHRLGKSMKVWAIFPDLTIIPLVSIDDWDPAWQGFYSYKKPIVVPAGTKMVARCVYDNTVLNPRNPNSPPQGVTSGGNASDEMLMLMAHVSDLEPGDEFLDFTDGSHIRFHHEKCDPEDPLARQAPFNDRWHSHLAPGEVVVYDMTGRLIYQGQESDLNRRNLRMEPYAFQRFSGVTVEMPVP